MSVKAIPFIGRKRALARLHILLKKKSASLVVIKGRRRIGKSRLVEEFAKEKNLLKFAGLAPAPFLNAQHQRDHFALQLSQQTGLPEIKTDDWSKLFLLLAERVKSGPLILLFDEITWMADQDETFLSKLQSFWEEHLRKNPQLIFIICGSITTWIEENILSSTGFYGRVSEVITLQELSLFESNQLLSHLNIHASSLEKFKILAITGGVPWYIEQISSELSINENIKRLCFTEGGLFVHEFDRIFSDLFGKRSDLYRKIIMVLSTGSADTKKIINELHYPNSGVMSVYLSDLVASGFIKRDFTWQLKTCHEQKFSQYRLSDNYLRFYLKYIRPKLNKIKLNQFENINISTFSNFEIIVGLQFENLILNNRLQIFNLLGIHPEDVVYDNPYFQRENTKQKGCQIDYMIQTKYHNLYVCEIKFYNKPIGRSIIKEVESKIQRLNRPKYIAAIPVLIHVSGVDESVVEEGYFAKYIDFSDLLTLKNT